MIRSVFSVLAAMALWAALWVAGNLGLAAALPDAFTEDGITTRTPVLLVILAWSVVLSVAAGWLVARLAGRKPYTHAVVLGLIQLGIGIGVQVGVWQDMPLWYHLLFLGLQVPAYLAGARMRGQAGSRVPRPALLLLVGLLGIGCGSAGDPPAAGDGPRILSFAPHGDLSAFNAEIDAACREGEAWPETPEAIADRFLGGSDARAVETRRENEGAENPVTATLVRTEEGLLDDSVRGIWTELRFRRADCGWRLVDARRAYRCGRGDHPDAFVAGPCP